MSFELIDTYHTDDPVLDPWTFVFSEVNPQTGYYTMLSTSNTGRGFSQWTEGMYDPNGDNAHLGYQVCLIGGTLLRHVTERMHEGELYAE